MPSAKKPKAGVVPLVPAKKPKPKAKAKPSKAPAPLTDVLGRSFPPAAADMRQGANKTVVDKGGRPYAVKDVPAAIEALRGLGAIMATTKECAAVLGISEPTLFSFWKRIPEARVAWESGKEHGKASLRRKQFTLAEKNATMAIFLGMQYLDQRDKRAFSGDPDNPIVHEHGGEVATKVTGKVEHDLSSLSLEQLVALHAAGVGPSKR